MLDSGNLQAASLYINNQLLSRGLLRDGQGIDFAMLGYGHGASSETSRRIISVVNELILRRDVRLDQMVIRAFRVSVSPADKTRQRDAEQRESLSVAMRDLRTENLKNTGDINRLTEKAAEAQRKCDIAEASEGSMRTQLKSAESAMRSLKDDLARTRAQVSQARAACAAEIKRRDRQIDTLKKQVGEAGRTRGAKGNAAIMTITVTGDVGGGGGGGGDERNSSRSSLASGRDSSLRSEANSFLANVAQGLGEENESLLRALKDMMEQLREMSGWAADEDADAQVIRQPSWEELSVELNEVMNHMRSILTNPSFVPIEEVIIREEEIDRLKAGWLKMESRWEDAVRLMDGWRKRMAVSGKPVNEEELKIGISLSPVRVRHVDETRGARKPSFPRPGMEDGTAQDALSGSPTPCARYAAQPTEQDYNQENDQEDDLDESGSEFHGFDDEILLDEYGVQIINEPPTSVENNLPHRASPESSPLPEPPQLSPLKNSSSAGNRRPQTTTVPASEMKPPPTAGGEPPSGPGDTGMANPPQRRIGAAQKEASHAPTNSGSSIKVPLFPKETEPPAPSISTAEPSRQTQTDHPPRKENERLPTRRLTRSRSGPQDGEAPAHTAALSMSTIAAKLAASEKEAEAARARAKLRSTRAAAAAAEGSRNRAPPGETTRPAAREDVDPVKRDPARMEPTQVEKRKRDRQASKTLRRRRSTLSSKELETLIVGAAP